VRGGSLIRVTMVVLSLLDVLHLVINTSMGEVAVLSLRGATDHCLSFVVLVLLQWDRSGLPNGGSRFDRMDRYIDRHGRMNVANPTFEESARHCFATFGTNPSVESFSRSRSWF
jgi:hypothetical protein